MTSNDELSWDELLEGRLSPGDVLAEKYRLDEIAGQGAMGFVLRAWHLQLDEPVAVKFLLPEMAASEEALARFEREARSAFKIKSEHVSRVLDVGRIEQGMPFMVMEYLEGTDLARILESDGPLPIDQAVDFVLQACDAIAEAHQLGIVHRDVKPENLYVVTRRDGSKSVKVLDFGLSKLIARTPGERPRALTSTEQVMGTAHYMSPEQWMSTKDVGPATDIWSIGVVLYELLTDHPPFLREKLPQMCNAVLRDEPPPLAEKCPDAPPELAEIIDRCLAKRAEDRYEHVGELAEALEPYASDAGASLAQRIARRSRPAPPISSPMPSSQQPSEEPLPRLGLRLEDGTIESWQEMLQETPPRRSKGPMALGAALLLIALAILGLAFAV